VLADRGDGWSAIWLTDEPPEYADRGSAGVVEGEAAIRVTQSFNMLGHARPGVAQRVGLNGNTGRVWIDDVRIERAESPGR
jgi:hypothetical protein